MDVDHRLRAPVELARFWALALGYVERELPGDFTSWEDWFRAYEIPEAEWDDGAGLSDPDGMLPRLTFLRVPEGKTAKSRTHFGLKGGGGRDEVPQEHRTPSPTEPRSQPVQYRDE